ncbi:hypothetical protein [Caldicellulosiruptor acetigenus]|uniref:Uncharacterized protein n=1 Tax=Caldicellulosiruptor acetigenus 6A TaxID=632516 RepID=G2PY33_9FIRM|nr:hypothetical protein [Caldicellulosiruptor acetigenus]AEM74900.1 hypothetical protein Calla_2372 [Caldicellulosiruptor acetigenus 6A]
MITSSLSEFSGLNVDYRIYSETEKGDGKNITILSINQSDKNIVNKRLNERFKEFNGPKVRFLKRIGVLECKTCKNRKYQDVSDDPGVSFKMPQHISPQFAASAVLAHEKQHVTRESEKAKQKGKEIVSSSILLTLSICPECGRVYVSGGSARVVSRESKTKDPFVENYNRTILNNFGVFVDVVV